MQLESLPNEILLDLFKYFSLIQLIRAFNDLNYRFNKLTFVHARDYHLDFRSISRNDFDIFHYQYLPLMIDRVSSLRLSDDDDDSPQQTNIFFSHGLNLKKFVHLRAISLCYVQSLNMLNKILIECQKLSCLTHVNIIKCEPTFRHLDSVQLFNNIWNLPKLTDCRLNMNSFHIPQVILLSLVHLSILQYYCGPKELNLLLKKIPRLQSLCLTLNDLNDESCLTSPIDSITSLKLCDVRSKCIMFNLLKNMPNLNRLVVDTSFIKIDGHQWENLIDNFLPNLIIFRLKMRIQYYGRMNNRNTIDTLFDSFRSQFWIEQHKWFIRCHQKLIDNYTNILIYTYPQLLSEFETNTVDISYKSTSLQDEHTISYQPVQRFIYESFLWSSMTFPLIHFSNISHLSISLPFDEKFWTVIENLDYLTSLSVSSTDANAHIYLQTLLDRAPQLYSLEIKSWPPSQIPLINNKSKSIRRLDLRNITIDKQDSYNRSLNTQHYYQFGNSPLARQCEILRIVTETKHDIITLVNTMPNIRVIFTTCKADLWKYAGDASSSEKYKFIKLLQSLLPSTSIITRDSSIYGFLQLWIR